MRQAPGLWGDGTMQQYAWGLVGTTPNSWSLVDMMWQRHPEGCLDTGCWVLEVERGEGL